MPRKPDRFERAATRAAYKLTWGKEHPDGGELQAAIVKELRKEHRWVDRLVKRYREDIFPANAGHAAEALLREIKQRRK